MNYLQSSTNDTQGPTLTTAWLPVLFGLTVISFESTSTMSGANTSRWLLDIFHWLWGQTDLNSVDVVNLLLRKLGHFCGYGTLGVLFRRAWYVSLRRSWEGPRSRLPFSASALDFAASFAFSQGDIGIDGISEAMRQTAIAQGEVEIPWRIYCEGGSALSRTMASKRWRMKNPESWYSLTA
jgi:hypothetical protein